MKLVLSGIEEFFSNQSINVLIDMADRWDIHYLELWVPRNTNREDMKTMKRILKERGKKVVCVTTWSHICLEKDVEPEIKLVEESLDWAEELESERINTYFGRIRRQDDKKATGLYMKNIEGILARAEKAKIKVCLENEFDSRGHDPDGSDVTRSADRLLKFLTQIDSPFFRLTYDPTNFYLAGEEPYPYAYEKLKNYIDYVHLKDTRKYNPEIDGDKKVWTDKGKEYVFLPIGTGVMNWDNIVRELREDNYDGYFTLEPHTLYVSLEDSGTDKMIDDTDKTFESLAGKKVIQDYTQSIEYIHSKGIK